MAASALSILATALTDIVDLEGDNTVLVQHLSVVVNNLATAELAKLHPELIQAPEPTPEKAPEGVTVQ